MFYLFSSQRVYLLIFGVLLSTSIALASPTNEASSNGGPSAPTLDLTYSKPVRASMLLGASAVGFPFLCASNQEIVFPMASVLGEDQVRVSFNIYSLSPGENILSATRFDLGMSGLVDIAPTNQIAISDSRLMAAVYAYKGDEKFSNKTAKRRPFLIFFERSGRYLHTVPALKHPFQKSPLTENPDFPTL